MTEYVEKQPLIEMFNNLASKYINGDKRQRGLAYTNAADLVALTEAADVQPINQCKMIPHEPDCRGYTDTFFCTNCQLHIHLGFIGQRYGGNYCIECGAEVEDGDTE